MSGDSALRAWTSIPRRIRKAIGGLRGAQLDRRGGSEGWTIREYVHHLVEANLVLSNIVLASLGEPGCRFDWSWLWPGPRRSRRLGYDRAPVEPALRLLEALCVHVAALARTSRAGAKAHVRLRISGSRSSRRTLVELFREEVDHARHHLADIASARRP